MFGLVLIKPEHPKSIETRSNFTFLDCIFGQGLFLIWLAILILVKTDQAEPTIAIIVISVGALNILFGWYGAKIDDKLKSQVDVETEKVDLTNNSSDETEFVFVEDPH